MEETPRPTDISREFLLDVERDREPFCSRPWRTLKVTMTGQTKICCDFFTRLPDFDWPTAQDFHRPDGMWNHPFMQHLRRTMGTQEEVPFCTLCLTKDKRSPEHRGARAEAKAESLEVYRSFEDVAAAPRYRGTLDEHEPLEDFSIPRPNHAPLRPFRRSLADYRRVVRGQGLFGRGRVLQVGAPAPAMAVFHAEANDDLVVTDLDVRALARVRALCAPFGLEPTTAALAADGALPVDDRAFDAAWLDGSLLQRIDRQRLLAEIARALREDGTVYVHRAPGPAPVKDLRHLLQRSGLKLDVSVPFGQHEDSMTFGALVPRRRAVRDLPAPSPRSPRPPA